MLGRPEIDVPVFMKVWAGSWLICSVTSERTTAISSAIPPMCGKAMEISWPDFPQRPKGHCGAKQVSLAPCSWAMGWPFVIDSGIGCPCSSASLGL